MIISDICFPSVSDLGLWWAIFLFRSFFISISRYSYLDRFLETFFSEVFISNDIDISMRIQIFYILPSIITLGFSAFYIFNIMESQVPEAGDIIVFSERLLFYLDTRSLVFCFCNTSASSRKIIKLFCQPVVVHVLFQFFDSLRKCFCEFTLISIVPLFIVCPWHSLMESYYKTLERLLDAFIWTSDRLVRNSSSDVETFVRISAWSRCQRDEHSKQNVYEMPEYHNRGWHKPCVKVVIRKSVDGFASTMSQGSVSEVLKALTLFLFDNARLWILFPCLLLRSYHELSLWVLNI